jgi:hypothetical protein
VQKADRDVPSRCRFFAETSPVSDNAGMNTSKHPEQWRDRLTAEGWKPETFLCMAQILGESVDAAASGGLSPEGERMLAEQVPPVDWARAYQAAPEFLGEIVRHFDPTITSQPAADEKSLGLWLRQTMEKVDAVIRGLAHLADPKTGMVSEEGMRTKELKALQKNAEAHVDQMRVEFKAGVDNLLAILLWGQTMSQLLAAAESEDDKALLQVLQLNRLLVQRDHITSRIQRAVQAQDHRFLQDLQQYVERRPTLQRQAKVGFILMVLWDVGLKRLTYKQIRGFLKTAGLQSVPTHQALERYGQRLGLKKYYIEPHGDERRPSDHEDE